MWPFGAVFQAGVNFLTRLNEPGRAEDSGKRAALLVPYRFHFCPIHRMINATATILYEPGTTEVKFEFLLQCSLLGPFPFGRERD